MPSGVLDVVRKMVATAADDRTAEGPRNNAAIKACQLIAEHKLLDSARPTGISIDDVMSFVDRVTSAFERAGIADHVRARARVTPRRYRRR